MLDILDDGPFRYIHCRATGEMILALVKVGNGFAEDEGEDEPRPNTLRHWKAEARRRIGERLITETTR